MNPKTYGGKIPFVEPLSDKRASYNAIIQEFADLGVFDKNWQGLRIVPAVSSLRSDIVLTGNLALPNKLAFNFRTDAPNEGMQSVQRTDNRLDINDMFVANEARVLFGLYTTATGVPSSAYLQQWPNNATATGAIGGGFGPTLAAAVLRAYSGTISMEVNTVKYMDGLSMLNFMYSKTAQAGTLLFTASTQGANDYEHSRGSAQLIPNMKFTGSSKTKFEVTIPEPLTFADGTSTMIVSLQLEGLKIQNGSQFANQLGL